MKSLVVCVVPFFLKVKIIGILVLNGFIGSFALNAASLNVQIDSPVAILMNATTGKVLYEKNGHQRSFPASTTKIATALYALHLGVNLDEAIAAKQISLGSVDPNLKRQKNYTLPSYWLETDGTHIGIKTGEILSMRNLLDGLMLESANDAANVIAQHMAPSIPEYMDGMNRYLQELGCTHTHFTNPHGLHHPNHYTTAYEMALIAREAMSYQIFRHIVRLTSSIRPKTNKHEKSPLRQHNKLLLKGKYFYGYATGIKTGYTAAAKSTLVASAEKNERELIAVIFQSSKNERFLDAIKLFEAAYAEPLQTQILLSREGQPLEIEVKGGSGKLPVIPIKDLVLRYFPSEEVAVRVDVEWENNLEAPIAQGQIVGHAIIFDVERNKPVNQVDLVAKKTIESTPLHKIQQLYKKISGGTKAFYADHFNSSPNPTK